MLGLFAQIYVAPHFAQPNSIEYQPALEWRRLQNATRACKRMHREQHAAKLAEVMRMYQKVSWHCMKSHHLRVDHRPNGGLIGHHIYLG